MGTCYYLWRDDNSTAYDLGKSYGWGDAFGCPRGTSIGAPMTLAPEDASELAELLVASLIERGYIKSELDRLDYYAFVAADVARWSEGKPFEFISEHDHRYEDACMDAYDRGAERETVVTGSRFESWQERGPRCACEEPDVAVDYTPAMCRKCGRYKMCPICGEHAAAGEVACEKHVHRARKKP